MIADRLRDRIRQTGPMSIAAFMTEALFDPREGYYATKDPIGAGADFITAPEISQMFGELMGLWAAQSWMDMGKPAAFQLVELGPGRGTMMADALRAARTVPGFVDAAHVVLIEASAALKAVQAQTLGPTGAQIRWVDRLESVPAGPAIVLGNEFLDCLPVRQAIRRGDDWHERMIGLDADEAFVFVLGPPLGADADLIPERLRDAPEDSLAELRPGDRQVVDALAARFAEAPGRALFIDYGPATSETGDTLQAVKAHKKVPPLEAPGTADLTARVDFESLAAAARAAGLTVSGPVTQGDFLVGLGLEARAAALCQAAPDKRAVFARQVWRLTDPEQMGTLFKLVCLDADGLPAPPGFAAR
ncbi:class I SAM-dependent methyltransferase [Maricaulis virginensis]|uniref:SAM-dependent methyltransferase n=1 Tax=Maricaulis virginensis TaxID=144022 RepID=A0A9W6IKV7_9PROT|nr:SAM-dependent methyltransferase [Maricaulis virginensis]GLK51364.1 SAM-dependent methyltransferase [Maricaulis virginensis]